MAPGHQLRDLSQKHLLYLYSIWMEKLSFGLISLQILFFIIKFNHMQNNKVVEDMGLSVQLLML